MALPAFPFDRIGARRGRLGLWVVIAIPEGVNYYQAVCVAAQRPDVYAESYLPGGRGVPARSRDARMAARSWAR